MGLSPILGRRIEFLPGICEIDHTGFLTGIDEFDISDQQWNPLLNIYFLFEGKLKTPPNDIFKRYDTISFFTQRGYRKFRKAIHKAAEILNTYHYPTTDIARWISPTHIVYQDELQILIERSVYQNVYQYNGH